MDPTAFHTCGKSARAGSPRPPFPRLLPSTAPVDNRRPNRSGYTRPRPASTPPPPYETDLPAERTQAEAQARLPRPHVDACRPADPQAPQVQGPQAPLGVSVAAQEPSFPLARLRCRLPPRPLCLDPLPDPVLVPA